MITVGFGEPKLNGASGILLVVECCCGFQIDNEPRPHSCFAVWPPSQPPRMLSKRPLPHLESSNQLNIIMPPLQAWSLCPILESRHAVIPECRGKCSVKIRCFCLRKQPSITANTCRQTNYEGTMPTFGSRENQACIQYLTGEATDIGRCSRRVELRETYVDVPYHRVAQSGQN